MNVDIQSVGKIGRASVALDGITLLAGPNATGKSTVCRTVKTFFSVLNSLGFLIRRERLSGIARLIERSFRNEYYGSIAGSVVSGMLVAADTEQGSADWLAAGVIESPEQIVRLAERQIGRHYAEEDVRFFVRGYEKLLPKLREILNESPERYALFVLQKKLDAVFSSQFVPLGDVAVPQVRLTAEATDLCVRFPMNAFPESSRPLTESVGIAPFSTHYLEPIHLLNRVSVGTERGCSASGRPETDVYRFDSWEESVRREDAADRGVTLEEMKERQSVAALLREMISEIHGRLERTDSRLCFRDSDTGQGVDVRNVASGAKTMALLIRALETGTVRRGDCVIIDEPEVHLHPAWTVRFANFLVLLVKHLDIRLLLTSHSPDFVKALQEFAVAAGMQDRTHFYLASSGTDGRCCVFEDLGVNVSKIFDSFNESFDLTDTLADRF